ncbi:hypothetical protein [Pseudofrankia sp. DC12]|uniref:hypothetical protein n=1 Tax=Pseudofrankia sp. DC12 TaxID=683315 RepID=UPI0005F7FF9A|nr:hypothetical protein [Pseudofrankia sp. DC12]
MTGALPLAAAGIYPHVLLAPRRTGQIIGGYDTWMNRHGWDVVLLVSVVSGLYFLASGIAMFLAGD